MRHCRKTTRHREGKKQLTWRRRWRRRKLGWQYHCKARCSCMKSHFYNPLSACSNQLSQPFLSTINLHTTAQRRTNVVGKEKMKKPSGLNPGSAYCSLQSWNQLLCSPRATIQCNTNCVDLRQSQDIWMWQLSQNGRWQRSRLRCCRPSLLFACWHTSSVVLFWRREVTKGKNLKRLSNFKKPLSQATLGLKGIESSWEMVTECSPSYPTTLPKLISAGKGESEEHDFQLRKWAVRQYCEEQRCIFKAYV